MEAPAVEPGAVRLGRLAVLLFTTVQCAGALVLGVRRQQRDAATKLDIWCLIMAVSGLCILLQSIVALTLTPTFRMTAVQLERHEGSNNFLTAMPLYDGVLYIVSWIITISLLGPLPVFHIGKYDLGVQIINVLGHNILCLILGKAILMGPSSHGNKCLRTVEYGSQLIGFALVVIFKGLGVYVDICHSLNLFGGPWPEDQPCPFLWKDSFADGILAF